MNMNEVDRFEIGQLTAKQIFTVISRNAEYYESPEAKLWLAVIGQAIFDGKKDGGYQWFKSGGHKIICENIGLNADLVSDICIRWMDAKTN